jgi:hypothetical protein
MCGKTAGETGAPFLIYRNGNVVPFSQSNDHVNFRTPSNTPGMAITPDTIVAFSAAFVALLSLGVSFWQLYEQRIFNRKTLRPLPWFFIRNGEDEFFVDIRNDGPGPMIVVSTRFELDGKSHPHLHCVLPSEGERHYSVLSPGKIIGAGKDARLWHQLPFASTTEDPEEYNEELQQYLAIAATLKECVPRVNATIEYTDVYGHKYPPHKRSFGFLRKMECED